ncbi:MAG: asparaginase domain-containing protein [Pseudomonadota bacterium]
MSVTLLYTGGTIGSAGVPLDTLPGPEFAALFDAHVRAHLPERVRKATLLHTDPTLDSTSMQPLDWLRLARRIVEIDGDVVVLHGTDTMAWTAAALAFLLQTYSAAGEVTGRLQKRVVVTGSQVPLFDGAGLAEGSDALGNLLGALAAARGGGGAVLHFAGDTLDAARVMKTSCTNWEAFTMPNGPGAATEVPATTAGNVLSSLEKLGAFFGRSAVIPLLAAPGAALGKQLAALASAEGYPLGAVHLLGFGIGNLPEELELTAALQHLRSQQIPVVISTQCPHGRIAPQTYAVGDWLSGCGVLGMGDRTPAAVQVKLHLTLALSALYGWGEQEMRAFLLRHVAGEDPPSGPVA